MASRVLLIGLFLVYIFATCLAIPADINYPFSKGSEDIDLSGHQYLSEDIQKNLRLSFVQPNEELIDEEALYDDDGDEGDEGETDNDALNFELSPISVTKNLPVESAPKNIILSSDSNGVGSYSVAVNDNGINQVVNIANPSVGVYDAVTIGPNLDTDVINTSDGVLIVGHSIFSDTLGQLVVFEGQNCELRSYLQGTPVRQALANSQCSQLRAQMEQARRRVTTVGSGVPIFQNVAQTTGFGQTLPQTYASDLSQGFPQTVTYPFGQTVTNPLGQTVTNPLVQTVSNPFGQTVTNPLGQTVTNPLGQTVTNPLLQTVSNPFGQTVTNPLGQTTTYPFGQTVTSPLGQTVTNPLGQTVTNPLLQTVSNPFGQTVTNPLGQTTTNPFGQTVINPLGQPITSPLGQTVTNPFGQTVTNPFGQTLTIPFGQILTETNPYGQTYSNTIGQTLSSNSFGQAFPYNFNQANSAFGSNWPLTASNVPLNGYNFIGAGNNPSLGSGGEFFGPGPGPRPRPPFQGRRRRPRP